MSFCRTCGSEIHDEAEICPKCGVRQLPVKTPKSRTVAGLLALFLGGLGAHKFYLGKPKQGLLYILLCWTFIPMIVAAIEGLMYFFESDESFAKRVS